MRVVDTMLRYNGATHATLDFQFLTLSELPHPVQDAILRDSLERRHEFERDARTMVDAWARGDEAGLAALVFEQADDPAFDAYFESVVFDPCGGAPESGEFLAVMNANAERLESLGARGRSG